MADWLQVVQCSSGEEFIEQLRPTHFASAKLSSDWLFRGVRNANWKLLPSAWRPQIGANEEMHDRLTKDPKFDAILSRWNNIDAPPFGLDITVLAEWNTIRSELREERIRKFIGQQAFEMQLLNDFWEIANEVGHPIEQPEWQQLGLRLTESVGESELHPQCFATLLTATAQHHGIPTRLLDWTLRPLVAAYFAADNAVGEEVAVWAVRRAALKRIGLEEFHVSRHALPFLHAQSGCFVWDPAAYPHFARTGEWRSQEEVLGNFYGNQRMPTMAIKFVLPVVEADRVLEMLWEERISKAHLMPTYDSVAHSVFNSFSWRDSMSFFE